MPKFNFQKVGDKELSDLLIATQSEFISRFLPVHAVECDNDKPTTVGANFTGKASPKVAKIPVDDLLPPAKLMHLSPPGAPLPPPGTPAVAAIKDGTATLSSAKSATPNPVRSVAKIPTTVSQPQAAAMTDMEKLKALIKELFATSKLTKEVLANCFADRGANTLSDLSGEHIKELYHVFLPLKA